MKTKSQPNLILSISLLVLIGLLIAGCGPQEPDTVTIGVINLSSNLTALFENFRDQMTEMGYIEGENIIYLYDGAAASIADLDTIAQEFVEADVDLIFAITTPASQAAQRATQDIPIIFTPVNDPVGSGLVDSLTNPGKNITGVMFGSQEEKRLDWFLQMVPDIKRIYIPYNPNDPSATAALSKVTAGAPRYGFEIVEYPVEDNDQISAAIENIPEDVDAIYMLPDSLVMSRITEFAAKALEFDLPTSVPNASVVPDGTLMAFGMSIEGLGEQAARLANQVLQNGINPGDLPVEVAEFILVINLKTAQAIGLEIPEEILRQADTIIRE
jgi:putative ABC transport system substrate-binding protein